VEGIVRGGGDEGVVAHSEHQMRTLVFGRT